MIVIKRGKLYLPCNIKEEFSNHMSTVLVGKTEVYLFSDEILNECAKHIDSLPAHDAQNYARQLFGTSRCARITRKGAVVLKDLPDYPDRFPENADLIRLKKGLWMLLPNAAEFPSDGIFRQELTDYQKRQP